MRDQENLNTGLNEQMNYLGVENQNERSKGLRTELNKLHTMTSGAVRSSDANDARYDLICPLALQRLAETYAEGLKKYGPDNWTKGLPIGETLNHALRHIILFQQGDRTEDHLAHAAWNLFAVMHFTSPCFCQTQRKLQEQEDAFYIKASQEGPHGQK